ncbi:uncharacterized protein [Panulirus ornatus]|uniref:uncharacterized protein isoform X2 n=1 Tax=Panulirus ornatus TaxID=150431 RepID=UPI003A89F79F
MADKQATTFGGATLKPSSSGVLKRSSSVEILTGVRPRHDRLVESPVTMSSSQLSTPSAATSRPLQVAPSSSLSTVGTPPSASPPQDRKLPTTSTPVFNGGVDPLQLGGSVGTLTPEVTEGASPKVVPRATGTPPAPRRKGRLADIVAGEKGGLPPLDTTHKVDASPPTGTPIGTPIIGKGGHIFTISTPVTEEDLPIRPPRKAVACEGDPFDQRRKVTPVPPVPVEDENTEPVWQRRLSLLFVPPTDNDLEPDKVEEETSSLLPKSSPTLHLKKKLSTESQGSPVSHRKEKEREAGRERKRKEGVVQKQQEEPRRRKQQPRIVFQDEQEQEEPDVSYLTGIDDDDDSSQRGIIGGNRTEDLKSKLSYASSQNSLSSLIREKMGKPQMSMSKKTTADLGLMVLVVVLLIIIIVGITLTTYFYNLHLLELSIFNCIKFYETPRILEIYDAEWSPVATAHLGSNLPKNSIPEDCTHYLHYLRKHNYSLPHINFDDEEYEDMICLDWTALAQLQLRKLYAEGKVQCYSVWWAATRDEFTLKDCIMADKEHGIWWGGGEMTDGGYPITNASIAPKHMVTGKLGRDSWGQLLRRTWLSEHASLLTLSEDFGGQVSINHESNGQICLESRPHPSLVAPLPTMKYTLCTAPNLTSLVYYLHQKAVNKRKIVAESARNLVTHIVEKKEGTPNSTPHPTNISTSHPTNISKNTQGILKEVFTETVIERVQERLEHPVWIPWMPPDEPELTQNAVLQYVDKILSQKYGFWGHILLPPSWQAQPGDLEFDRKRFPDPVSLAETLEKKGFHLALTIHPFVSVEAPAFNAGTQEGLWVRQKDSALPALTQYDEKHPSVVTDFSNPRAKQWFSSRLQRLQKLYTIERFHLQPADAHALPIFHEYHMPLPGPDAILIHFMASVSTVSPPLSTEGTVTPPLPPTFLTLGTADGSWAGLETLVPRVLTLAMLGYPLIDVGPIGGIARAGHVPDRELYIRWLEAATFLPAMQVSVLPNMYDEVVVNLTSEYTEIRKKMVLPRLLEKISGALQLGTPLITPLALFAPNDSDAASVDDQWILGNDLLVAPITHRGQRLRSIYLPAGIWKDEIDGHLRRGEQWINNYKVPLTKIPHFTLKSLDDFDS